MKQQKVRYNWKSTLVTIICGSIYAYCRADLRTKRDYETYYEEVIKEDEKRREKTKNWLKEVGIRRGE